MASSRFTTANAREMQARSHAARIAAANQPPAPPAPVPQVSGESSGFVASRLAQVREHIQRLDELMRAERDALNLDRLARALSALSEQERILDGRPLPGARKPGPEKAKAEPDIRPL